MSVIKINEQLSFLRKQKNITQEELAQVLGITNQSVSKWESGACCPDITLLPEIATYFNVTIDELLGYKPADSFGDVYLKIKSLFQESPQNISFDLAYKLAFVLHEGAVSKGYKGYLPWDCNKNRTQDEDFYKWGFSACSEPEGVSIMKGNAVLIASNKLAKPVSSNDLRELYNALQRYGSKDNLRVLFSLYELTINDFDVFVEFNELVEKCKLPSDIVEKAIDNLPIQTKLLEDGKDGYRIEGGYMHIPTVLMLLTQ